MSASIARPPPYGYAPGPGRRAARSAPSAGGPRTYGAPHPGPDRQSRAPGAEPSHGRVPGSLGCQPPARGPLPYGYAPRPGRRAARVRAVRGRAPYRPDGRTRDRDRHDRDRAPAAEHSHSRMPSPPTTPRRASRMSLSSARPPPTATRRGQGVAPQGPCRPACRPGSPHPGGPAGRAWSRQAGPGHRRVQADGPWCPGLAHLCMCGRMLQYAKCAGAVVRPVRTFVLRRTT
jgi:hypothetical protein